MRCFGDRGIKKVYLPLVVADYEGGGVSAGESHPDSKFLEEFPELVRIRFGRLWNQLYRRLDKIERLQIRLKKLFKTPF